MRLVLLIGVLFLLLSCSAKNGSEQGFDMGVRGKVEIRYGK
ncbi:hypothetical protein [Hydrogenivirga sp. 128-5-R1-1]|nr:hypothetical protein [Hydrogenivirga sp. 128-5-R1-1]EDP75138.1 hypothetical protein HG1285_00200 [Hydrogenivirga sp. 128-5-R1-1]